MPSHKCRHHDEEQSHGERQSKGKVWIQTNKRVYEEEGQSMCGVCPVDKTDNLVLKCKDYSDSAITVNKRRYLGKMAYHRLHIPRIEAAEVISH